MIYRPLFKNIVQDLVKNLAFINNNGIYLFLL
jgi:hypothetical protein